jgi:hypothetical protein
MTNWGEATSFDDRFGNQREKIYIIIACPQGLPCKSARQLLVASAEFFYERPSLLESIPLVHK